MNFTCSSSKKMATIKWLLFVLLNLIEIMTLLTFMWKNQLFFIENSPAFLDISSLAVFFIARISEVNVVKVWDLKLLKCFDDLSVWQSAGRHGREVLLRSFPAYRWSLIWIWQKFHGIEVLYHTISSMRLLIIHFCMPQILRADLLFSFNVIPYLSCLIHHVWLGVHLSTLGLTLLVDWGQFIIHFGNIPDINRGKASVVGPWPLCRVVTRSRRLISIGQIWIHTRLTRILVRCFWLSWLVPLIGTNRWTHARWPVLVGALSFSSLVWISFCHGHLAYLHWGILRNGNMSEFLLNLSKPLLIVHNFLPVLVLILWLCFSCDSRAVSLVKKAIKTVMLALLILVEPALLLDVLLVGVKLFIEVVE